MILLEKDYFNSDNLLINNINLFFLNLFAIDNLLFLKLLVILLN